jgi:hypothetical protein
VLGKLLYQLTPLVMAGALTTEEVTQIYSCIIRKGAGLSKNAKCTEILDLLGRKKLQETIKKIVGKKST